MKHLICDREAPRSHLKPSLGRISFWIAFGCALYVLVTRGDVPPGAQWLIATLLAYCGLHKAVTRDVPTPTPLPIPTPKPEPVKPPSPNEA